MFSEVFLPVTYYLLSDTIAGRLLWNHTEEYLLIVHVRPGQN